MKHIIRSIAFFTCMWLWASSCTERHKIKKALVEFTKSEIVIPSDLECINNRQIKEINTDTLKPLKFIVYYDSLECSACRISHLVDIYPLYDMADTCDFSVITVFSPKLSEVSNVQNQLRIANHTIPIYIDKYATFRHINKSIPSDHRFHYFLLNENNSPVFVGNPLSSPRLHDLFIEAIGN